MGKVKDFWRSLPQHVRQPLHPVSLAYEVAFGLIIPGLINAIVSVPPMSLVLIGVGTFILVGTGIGVWTHRRLAARKTDMNALLRQAYLEAKKHPPALISECKKEGSASWLLSLRLDDPDHPGVPMGAVTVIAPGEIEHYLAHRGGIVEVRYPQDFESAPGPIQTGLHRVRWATTRFKTNDLSEGKDETIAWDEFFHKYEPGQEPVMTTPLTQRISHRAGCPATRVEEYPAHTRGRQAHHGRALPRLRGSGGGDPRLSGA